MLKAPIPLEQDTLKGKYFVCKDSLKPEFINEIILVVKTISAKIPSGCTLREFVISPCKT